LAVAACGLAGTGDDVGRCGDLDLEPVDLGEPALALRVVSDLVVHGLHRGAQAGQVLLRCVVDDHPGAAQDRKRLRVVVPRRLYRAGPDVLGR